MIRNTVLKFGIAFSIAGAGWVASAAGPVRLIRVEYVQGDVLWRPTAAAKWSAAPVNLPIRQGAEVWADGGRAELQFDDGSVLRLGAGAVATVESLYSDADGEFTEVKLDSGKGSFHLKNKYSIYQVDTPFESVKAAGPAEFRCDVGKEVDVAVHSGKATLNCAEGNKVLTAGEYVRRDRADGPIAVIGTPIKDSWDGFDAQRDVIYDDPVEHVPADVALVSSDLRPYGHWRHVHHYGWVWAPTADRGWRPYEDGNWVWVDPVGWTWVSNEPWGWAPYHYGSWVHLGVGWAWDPGPYHQYWSPAVVDFTSYNGDYCWTPLCPEEVHYPAAINIGFNVGDWWLDFSIGGCATYLPVTGGFCDPVVFDAALFVGPGWGPHWRNRWGPDWDRFRSHDHFIPRNAAFGSTMVSAGRFGQSGRYLASNADSRGLWRRGRTVMASNRAFSGPISARPGPTAYAASRRLVSNARPAAMNRSLYRAPVSSRVARTSQPFGRATSGERIASARSRVQTHGSMTSANVRRARESLGFVGRSGRRYQPGRTGLTASRNTTNRSGRTVNRGSSALGHGRSGVSKTRTTHRGGSVRRVTNNRLNRGGKVRNPLRGHTNNRGAQRGHTNTRSAFGRSNTHQTLGQRGHANSGQRQSGFGSRSRGRTGGGFGGGQGRRGNGGGGQSRGGQRGGGGDHRKPPRG